MTLYQLLDNFYTITHHTDTPRSTKETYGMLQLVASIASEWFSEQPLDATLSIKGWATSYEQVNRMVGTAEINRESGQILRLVPDRAAQVGDWEIVKQAFKRTPPDESAQ